jgi:hypothetical protein
MSVAPEGWHTQRRSPALDWSINKPHKCQHLAVGFAEVEVYDSRKGIDMLRGRCSRECRPLFQEQFRTDQSRLQLGCAPRVCPALAKFYSPRNCQKREKLSTLLIVRPAFEMGNFGSRFDPVRAETYDL